MIVIRAARASAILYSLLIGRKDKRPWLMPANICPIVPITFFKANIPIQLVDIAADTLNMDIALTDDLLRTRKYGGVLYAHTYGENSTPDSFFVEIKSRQPDLMILDDRCLCTPDLDPDVATNADVILYSTGYAKVVELEFGGYAFLKEDVPYNHAVLSYSPNMHEELEKTYKSAIKDRNIYVYQDSDWLDTSLNLPSWYDYRRQIESQRIQTLEYRKQLNQLYSEALPKRIQLHDKFQTWRFNLRVKNQSELLDDIFSAGLFASAHYASLAGIMVKAEAPQAGLLANEVINLFNDNHFTLAQAERASQIIRESLS